MPEGEKSRYTDKQKRKAEHIEGGYEKRGMPVDEAERIAWATVNKQDGGNKSGSGQKSTSTLKSKPGGAKKRQRRKPAAKKAAARAARNDRGPLKNVIPSDARNDKPYRLHF